MKIIAVSGSTRTRWALTEGDIIVEMAETSGLNPYFLTRREISHIVRLDLPDTFFRRRWDHVYFYGAGCGNPEKNKMVESSLIAQFRSPVEIHSDLLGAARSLHQHSAGLACIISTGTNSCYYDGESIIKNVRPGGFILGDEGSNSHMGKVLVADVIREIAPRRIIEAFYKRFDITAEDILDMVYTQPQANRTLSDMSVFLQENIHEDYCRKLVYDSFMLFFNRNIAAYDYITHGLSVIGSAACAYREIFDRAAADFGVHIDQIHPSSLEGLIKYHALD